jgi:hypothetical protein
MLSHKFSQDLNVFLSITKRRILKKKGEKKHPWCNCIYEVQIGINSCCSLKIYPSCTIPHSMGQQSCWIGVLQTYPNPLKFNPAYSAVKWVTTPFQTPSLTYSLFFPECDFEHPSMKQTIDPIPRFKINFFLREKFQNLGVSGLKKCLLVSSILFHGIYILNFRL